MLDEIKQMMADFFGMRKKDIDKTDHLRDDWGVDDHERDVFDQEFCAAYGVDHVPTTAETVADYVKIARRKKSR